MPSPGLTTDQLWDSEEITLNSPPSSTNLWTLSAETNWEEVKNKRWNSYLQNLALTQNKINVKKARKYFDQLWDNEASLREVTNVGDNAKKKLDDLIFNFRDDWSLLKEKVDTLIEGTKPSVNFNSVEEALLWLTNNGYNTRGIDNMYGANTNAAINTALQDTKLDPEIKKQLTALLELYKGKWVPLKLKIVNPYTTNILTVEVSTPDLILTTKGQTFGKGIPSITNATTLLPTTQVTNPNISLYNIVGTNGYYSTSSMLDDFDKKLFEKKFNTTNLSRPNLNNLGKLWEDFKKSEEYANEWRNFLNLYELSPAHWGLAKLFENKWVLKKQQGGNLNNMNQQEILKKAFINYLVQVTGAKTELDLAKLGLDLIKQLYQLFTTGIQDGSIEVSQDGQVNVKGRKAALGAKLNYFNKLQGKCPEGEQLVTFKIGGRMCTACLKGNKVEKKQTTNLNTNQQPKKLDPEKTPVLPGGKYPSYWTADDRIKWERKYGLKDEGAAVSPPPRKNQLGAALLLLLNKNR